MRCQESIHDMTEHEMIPCIWFQEARQRIADFVRTTPLTHDPQLNLYIKWENQQLTGSFKLRGALNKTLGLQFWERERGLITASAGNHGQGVALAGQITGAPVTVFAPHNAPQIKLDGIRKYGAQLRLIPGGYGEAERVGLEFARTHNGTWISPYNDVQVIAGQGTLALEILPELPLEDTYTWVIPCGGGGLISGIGLAIHCSGRQSPHHRVVGIQSEASPYMHAIFHQGTQAGVAELDSMADGLSGPVENGSVTIPITPTIADDFRLVSEEQIAGAVVYAWHHYHEVIEPSSAAALAAVIYGIVNERPAVVIISGGNIQPEIHQRLIGNSTARG